MQKIKGVKDIYGEGPAEMFQVDVLNANHACLWRTKQIFASTEKKTLIYFFLHLYVVFFSACFVFFWNPWPLLTHQFKIKT